MGDDLDDVWDKMTEPRDDEDADAEEAEAEVVDVGPPVRATFLVRADAVPVAPWAQGWRVGTIGPEGGHVTIVCEHDIDLSPVAQLSAVTGILSTLKQAQLDVVWWTIQARGPLELGEATDMDAELAKLLDPDSGGDVDRPEGP